MSAMEDSPGANYVLCPSWSTHEGNGLYAVFVHRPEWENPTRLGVYDSNQRIYHAKRHVLRDFIFWSTDPHLIVLGIEELNVAQELGAKIVDYFDPKTKWFYMISMKNLHQYGYRRDQPVIGWRLVSPEDAWYKEKLD